MVSINKVEALTLSQENKPRNSSQCKIAWQISIFLGSVDTMTNWCVLTFHQVPVFNGKTNNLQSRKYDFSMTSPVAKKTQLFHQWSTCFLLNVLWKFCGNQMFRYDVLRFCKVSRQMTNTPLLNRLYVLIRGLLFSPCFSTSFNILHFSETRQRTKTKIWGKTTLTWNELWPNSSEIRWGILEWEAFHNIYNRRPDKSAANQTYSGRQRYDGPCPKFLVMVSYPSDPLQWRVDRGVGRLAGYRFYQLSGIFAELDVFLAFVLKHRLPH